MSQSKQFISEFCRWAGEGSEAKSLRARLSAALQKTLENELPSRDQQFGVTVRPLVNSEGLLCRFSSPELRLYVDKHPQLLCATVAPRWERGWSEISRDVFVKQIVSDFFYLATQYVIRSRMTNVVGSIVLTYERDTDFRHGDHASWYAVENESLSTEFDAFDEMRLKHGLSGHTDFHASDTRRQREFATWVQLLNSLDPFIQRAIYQYWKATALFRAKFWEEGITALDALTSVSAQFVQERFGERTNPRLALTKHLGISDTDNKLLARLHDLRSDFGAHPSRSKWWDFVDIYSDDVELFRDCAKRLIWGLCKAENKNRRIEARPKIWSDWFASNAQMLFDSVWFLHLR
jgi:hypothetical protein